MPRNLILGQMQEHLSLTSRMIGGCQALVPAFQPSCVCWRSLEDQPGHVLRQDKLPEH